MFAAMAQQNAAHVMTEEEMFADMSQGAGGRVRGCRCLWIEVVVLDRFAAVFHISAAMVGLQPNGSSVAATLTGARAETN
jgi:hypothetical protein